jgi:ATP-dependent DNA helicase RecG
VYHRSHEEREPVEVQITAEDLMVLSFPRPDRSIPMQDLRAGKAVSRRYRNRRIGEFLKELDLTEGRSTGVPKSRRSAPMTRSAMRRVRTPTWLSPTRPSERSPRLRL